MRRVRGSPGAGKGGMVQVVSSAGKVSMLVWTLSPLCPPSPPMTTPAIKKLYDLQTTFSMNLIGHGSKTYSNCV